MVREARGIGTPLPRGPGRIRPRCDREVGSSWDQGRTLKPVQSQAVLTAEAQESPLRMAVNLSIDQVETRQYIPLGTREVLHGLLAGGVIQPELDDLGILAQYPGEDTQRHVMRLADPDGVDRVQGADRGPEQARLPVERIQGILEGDGDRAKGLVTLRLGGPRHDGQGE